MARHRDTTIQTTVRRRAIEDAWANKRDIERAFGMFEHGIDLLHYTTAPDVLRDLAAALLDAAAEIKARHERALDEVNALNEAKLDFAMLDGCRKMVDARRNDDDNT